MSDKDTGGPAFPQDYEHVKVLAELAHEMTDNQLLKATKQLAGMTLRHYAAIHLKVPNSGDEWLDEMITESAHKDFAAKAMQGYIMDEAIARDSDNGMVWLNKIAKASYEMADTMIKARNQT